MFSKLKEFLKTKLSDFAEKRQARLVLFLHSFIDSSVIPVTVDISFVPIAIARPKRAFQFAFWTSLGSVLGCLFAYLIGSAMMEVIGFRIIELFNLQPQWLQLIEAVEGEVANITIAVAAITPLSFTLAGFAAGAVKMDFSSFFVIALIFRTLRFILLSFLIYYFGAAVKTFLDRYYNTLAGIFLWVTVLTLIIIIFVL